MKALPQVAEKGDQHAIIAVPARRTLYGWCRDASRWDKTPLFRTLLYCPLQLGSPCLIRPPTEVVAIQYPQPDYRGHYRRPWYPSGIEDISAFGLELVLLLPIPFLCGH